VGSLARFVCSKVEANALSRAKDNKKGREVAPPFGPLVVSSKFEPNTIGLVPPLLPRKFNGI